MTPTTPHHRILLIGLIFSTSLPPSSRALFPAVATLERAVRDDLAVAASRGFAVSTLFLDPSSAADGLARLGARLRDAPPDAVVVGTGLRVVPEFTELLERVVGTCREAAPGVPVGFNRAPGSTSETLERWFGQAG
ncbi:hypothetical protein F4780DRAFT_779200 [Xylariomycetidae sp. FL0641]|nr:hypothetical protein F4780DRAFT_779200 [Xylariomycetidae sp. FL0641]